jgi:hypothetical protein
MNDENSLYDFEIKYKPGNQNVIADFLLRPQENEQQQDMEEDSLDQLIASIESLESESKINYQVAMNELYSHLEIQEKIISIKTNDTKEYEASMLINEIIYEINKTNVKNIDQLNINVISSQPSSNTIDNYKSYAEEQLKDDDIQWIKELIEKNGDQKPKINAFKNEIQQMFFREYENLRVIDNIVYITTEDTNGYNRTQFVLPKQITHEVITQIHTSVYNAHLGRKKTMHKIIERMYRPKLKEEIINIV